MRRVLTRPLNWLRIAGRHVADGRLDELWYAVGYWLRKIDLEPSEWSRERRRGDTAGNDVPDAHLATRRRRCRRVSDLLDRDTHAGVLRVSDSPADAGSSQAT